MALEQRILAIDPGQRKIGLALSDPTQTLARPYAIWPFADSFWDQLSELLVTENIASIIVGVPHGLRGESAQTRWTLGFISDLQQEVDIPVIKRSEIFTTKIAQQKLSELSRKDQKGDDDALAAATLLQDYLDQPNN